MILPVFHPDSPTAKFIATIIVIISAIIITRIIAYLLNKMHRFEKDMTAIYLIRDLIEYTIYFIALITILQFFGVDLAGTLLSLGIVGIAVSFAAKDIISNWNRRYCREFCCKGHHFKFVFRSYFNYWKKH